MNIVKMIRISDGKEFQGFIDRDRMNFNVLFYFFEDKSQSWCSDTITNFKPYTENKTNVVGG